MATLSCTDHMTAGDRWGQTLRADKGEVKSYCEPGRRRRRGERGLLLLLLLLSSSV
jgi:hypothetical protein